MMCHRMGRPPISTIGLGRNSVSSRRRVPKPPHRTTTFISGFLPPACHKPTSCLSGNYWAWVNECGPQFSYPTRRRRWQDYGSHQQGFQEREESEELTRGLRRRFRCAEGNMAMTEKAEGDGEHQND